MAYAILDKCPTVGYSYEDSLPVAVLAFSGPHQTTRVRLAPRSVRAYNWAFSDMETERQWYQEFFEDLKLPLFLVKDPKDFEQIAVPLTLISGQTYGLPTSGDDARHYPYTPMIAYDDGFPVTIDSFDTDNRTITLLAPPSGAVTLDFVGLRLCRLAEHFTWQQQAQGWWVTSIPIQEVMPD